MAQASGCLRARSAILPLPYTETQAITSVKTPGKFTLLLYDGSWGLSLLQPAENDPVYTATSDCSLLARADAVVFHIPTAPHPSRLPKRAGQKWVACSMESDANYPQLLDAQYMAYFDFRMTYRWDCDVPLMYCETTSLSRLLAPPQPKTAEAEAAFFASNPKTLSRRSEYAGELMRYLKVDCYGRVFRDQELSRDEGRESKLETIARYRFDLEFENSISRDYVTEKFFDPLIAGCVPVYRGPPTSRNLRRVSIVSSMRRISGVPRSCRNTCSTSRRIRPNTMPTWRGRSGRSGKVSCARSRSPGRIRCAVFVTRCWRGVALRAIRRGGSPGGGAGRPAFPRSRGDDD
jgi:hypothetical protein